MQSETAEERIAADVWLESKSGKTLLDWQRLCGGTIETFAREAFMSGYLIGKIAGLNRAKEIIS